MRVAFCHQQDKSLHLSGPEMTLLPFILRPEALCPGDRRAKCGELGFGVLFIFLGHMIP